MKKADFRFPDAQISGSHGWLKLLLVGVSIITSSALAVGQDQESPTDQGFAAIPLPEVQYAREAARSVYPTKAQRLDLGAFSTQEEDEILELLNVSTANYTGIYREVRLQRANWALVKQENGLDVWQAHVYSPAAISLGLHLRNFHLDPGMAVKLYSLTDEEDPVEEYTGEGRSGNRGGFWSYPISGDTVVMEFRTPTASRLEPDAFPFAADKVNHTFKDRNGDLPGTQLQKFQAGTQSCQHHDKTENTAVLVNSDMPAHVLKASAGTVLICAYGEHGSGCGTGSLLKNKSGDGALYALSVWHLFLVGVNDPNTDDKPYINSDFSIQVKGEWAGRARASGSRFIAGDAKNDWGLVRIEGQFRGWGNYQLLDWKVRTPENFAGYVLHYSYLLDQQYSPFGHLQDPRYHPYGLEFDLPDGRNAPKPAVCSGSVCSGKFYANYTGYRVEYGGSGSPAYYENTSSVVGVYVTFHKCNGGFAGMGNIYKNPKVFNALNYGDAYFHNSQFPYIDPEVVCAADSQAMAGSGTESDPYQVENLCHLRGVEASPRSHYIQIKDIDASTMTYGWKNGFAPIKVFSGTYDGNGYKISNLKVGVTYEGLENVGLFGELQGGLLKRVKLVGFLTENGVNVGSLVGLNNRGTIEDSEVDGKVDGYRTIGGLVGLNQGGVIRNSTATVRVGENSSVTWVAGGLVGQNDGGTIVGSHASGGVTGGNQVGGLVGKNRGSVTSSHANGDVTGTDSIWGYAYVGGLVGWHLGGTISDSYTGNRVVGAALGIGGLVGVSEGNARIVSSYTYWESRVSGKNKVGGLVGENKGSISGSYANGTVFGDSQTGGLVGVSEGNARIVSSHTDWASSVSGKDQVGALVGENKGSISGSYAQGSVSGDSQVGGLVGRNAGSISNNYARRGSVSGDSQVGGLVGVNESNANIVNSHTRREVRVSGKDQVGGLVGENKGSISDSYAQGAVTGDRQAGGLVGGNDGRIVSSHTDWGSRVSGKDQVGGLVGKNKGSISNSYAKGTVTGDRQAGGLVGVNGGNASIVNSHTNVNARVTGKNQVGGLVGENWGSIGNSYAQAPVTGDSQTGGLVGENKGTIGNSYARGAVTGGSQTGGLAGVNSGLVRSAYSTGAVGGTDLPGRLVGVNGGTIDRSYASKLGDVDSLVGGNDGAVQGSDLRTLEQMKCSILPVNLCRAAGVYLDWDTRIWHFGNSRLLPVLRVLTDVPVAPLAVRANWNSRGGLTLQWEHQGIAVSSFEVAVGGIIRDTRVFHFALDDTLMAELRERHASGSEIHYSIRGVKRGVAGDAASGSFHLMKVPGEVGTQTASGLSTIRVTITKAATDGYGRAPGSSAYGKPAGGVALDLVYHVQLFSKGLLKEDRHKTQQEWSSSTVVEFSGLEGGSRYEVRVFARNKAGAGPTEVAPAFTYVEACPWAAMITAAGSGSEDDPWQIGSLCQLQEIRYDTAAHYRLANDIDAKQSHEWRDGKGFSPIEFFSGSLDGSGHSILSLLINPGQTDHVGLFGKLSGGALQRLALVNVTVRGRDATGALAGSVETNGSIKGSTVTGLIGGRRRVGGVAGENHGLIKLSHSESTVIGTTDSQRRSKSIGGLVGKNFPGARIRSSHARGSVSGAGSVGGLVGLNQAPIYHSHVQSTVSGHHSVGGLAGSNYGFISGSYSAGAVSGVEDVGGLTGWHSSNSIVDSRSDSTVTSAGNRVGGLVGLSSGSILRSHATGAVSGNEQVGGLAGESRHGSIDDSYATGSVGGNEQIGGLTGNSERSTDNNIRIDGSYAAGLVNGNNQAGMLVGHSEGTDMAANYALEPGVGSSALELVGSGEEDATENNFSRTLAQLQCPLLPGDTCQGAISYSGWSTQIWYFGDEQTLPVHRALRAVPPAPPSRLQARWNLEGELELSWTAARTVSLNAGYWVEVAGHSLETESASFTFGRRLVQNLRSEYRDSTLQVSVRGYNRHGMSEATTVAIRLLRAPGKLTVVRASAQAFSLQVLLLAPADDGYGQSPEDPAYGYTSVGVSAGLGYRVRLYAGGELVQERERAHTVGETPAVVEFSGLASNSFYEVEATPYNNVGEGSSFFLSAFTRPWQCDGEALASAGGSGSEDDPLQIATLCQLQDIRSAPAAHYRLASDIEAGPSRDWRAGEGFAPIADFSGSFDGAGYQIFHLRVRSEVLEDVGMFAQLQGGLLQQVVLVNAQLWGSVNVGALAGRNEGGRIVNSGATGSLFGGQVTGGLVGINAGTIRGSAAQLTTEPGGQVAGGLVGRNLTGGSINTSYAGGSVSGAVRAGGLVADNRGSVTDSYTTAFVTGEGLVAGLVADNQGTVSRSYVAGSVSGAGQHGSFTGSSSGGIADSYAAALPRVNGASMPFVADDAGQGSVSLRTLQQLRCPTAPGLACAGRSTYSGWSAEIWSFGDYRTLPVLRGFETPGKPLRLLAQWKSPSSLLLRWEPPLHTKELIAYRIEAPSIAAEETASLYYVGGSDWLQKLRARHEGGNTLFLTVRGYNLYGVGEAARVSVRLLDVPDSPADMRVEPGVSTLRLSFTAPANDGYGRRPVDADYATSAEAMALRLAYRIHLYASGELVEERDIPLGSPLNPVTVEFTELKSAFAYRLEAFAHNTVGTGSASTIRAVTSFPGCAGKGLKSASGDGSGDNPWQIGTLCQLQDVRSDLYAHYVQVADIDARSSREWSGGAGFHPIEPFSGTFDGAGRQISALYINRPETNTVGLFSRLAEDGIAKGVVLVDAWVKGKNSVGALVGFNDGTVMNSVVRSAQVSGNRAGLNIGGLAGGNGGLLIDSGASAEVGGGRYVGGLVGYVKAKGRVVGSTVRASQVSALESAGGLAGLALGAAILHSSADAAVRVTGEGRDNAGGLVGYSQGSTILHCYATGSAIAVDGSRAGGLVGYSGSTIAYSYADVSVSGDSRVGGLVGINSGSVHASYALGEVRGHFSIGGLVGNNIRRIQDSYAANRVVGESGSTGSLAGYSAPDAVIDRSYAPVSAQASLVGSGLTGSSSPRTLTQLRCPTAAGQRCAGATTYAGWEPGAWHFGNTRTLPLLRALVDIPAAPVDLAVSWESPDHLRFTWAAGSPAVDSYELELAGTIREVTAPTFDFNGDFLAEFRKNKQVACPHPYRLRAVRGDVAGYQAAGHFYLPGLPGATTITELVPGQTTARLVLAIMGHDDCANLAGDTLATSPDRVAVSGFGYVVVVSAGGRSTETFFPVVAFGTEIEITDLLPKRSYSLQVYARNRAGAGELAQASENRSAFSTIAMPGRPSGLRARWKSADRVHLSWEAASSNRATIDSYQLSVDGKSHPVSGTATSYVLSDHVLAQLRKKHAGGEQIRYSLRAVNRAGTGAMSTAAFTLLDVLEGTLAMQLMHKANGRVQVHLQYSGNDGYGRTADHADFGAPVDGILLGLGYRVQLISYGELIEEQSVAMPTPGGAVKTEFTGLQGGVAYEVRAFPQDSVAELPGVSQFINWDPEIPTTPRPGSHHVKKLRLRVFLGGMIR